MRFPWLRNWFGMIKEMGMFGQLTHKMHCNVKINKKLKVHLING